MDCTDMSCLLEASSPSV